MIVNAKGNLMKRERDRETEREREREKGQETDDKGKRSSENLNYHVNSCY